MEGKNMDLVSVEKCSSYDAEKIAAIVESQFVLFESAGPIFREGASVVIKPNLLLGRKPEEATTVHPYLVGAIIRAVKKRGGIPLIAESPSGPYTERILKSVYSVTGMEGIAVKEGARLNYDTESINVPAKGSGSTAVFHLLKPIVKADAVICAGKVKTHTQMVYTGAVKNLFGTVPGLEKPEFHSRFPEKEHFASMIVDLCETVHPVLSFLDGITGMEGNGPSGGKPVGLGLLFAGKNPYAVDAAVLSKIGFSIDRVPVLREAEKRKLWEGPELSGSGKDEPPVPFQYPDSTGVDPTEKIPVIHNLVSALFSPHPVIVKKICIGCGKCSESCPRHTIQISGGKAVIIRSGCIKCFCCQEVCPQKAIWISGLLAGHENKTDPIK